MYRYLGKNWSPTYQNLPSRIVLVDGVNGKPKAGFRYSVLFPRDSTAKLARKCEPFLSRFSKSVSNFYVDETRWIKGWNVLIYDC